VTKQKGEFIGVDHIGSAHLDEDLRVLLSLAHKRIHTNQMEMFPEAPSRLKVKIKRTYSGLLWSASLSMV
jgi:hypothetical protein